MSEIQFEDDGGSISPTGGTKISYHDNSWSIEGGMSLRDWFAGQVLPAVVANGNNISSKAAAQSAYEFANAMIAMRNSIVEPEPTRWGYRKIDGKFQRVEISKE